MFTPVTTQGLFSWPGATLERLDGRDVIVSGGTGQKVLPIGVRMADGWEPADAAEVLGLEKSMYEIHEELRELVTEADPGPALVSAMHRYPVPELCAAHGLPWHHETHTEHVEGAVRSSYRSLPCPRPTVDARAALFVDHLVAMVTGIQGIQKLARHLTGQRVPIPSQGQGLVEQAEVPPARRQVVEQAMLWPVQDARIRSWARQEVEQNGHLSVARGRQLVTSTIAAALEHSRLTPGFEWNQRHPPELVLRARTGTASYVADFARHVVDGAVDSDRIRECSHCGDEFVPRRRSGAARSFCPKQECQLARKRWNQATYEARQKRMAHE